VAFGGCTQWGRVDGCEPNGEESYWLPPSVVATHAARTLPVGAGVACEDRRGLVDAAVQVPVAEVYQALGFVTEFTIGGITPPQFQDHAVVQQRGRVL